VIYTYMHENINFVVRTSTLKQVKDVNSGIYSPPALIRILGIRDGRPFETEVVLSTQTDFTRLNRKDYIEPAEQLDFP